MAHLNDHQYGVMQIARAHAMSRYLTHILLAQMAKSLLLFSKIFLEKTAIILTPFILGNPLNCRTFLAHDGAPFNE